MTERRKLDDPLAAPLARALGAGLDRSGHKCPDAEVVALYFDHALASDEAARWELHFATCARCQKQLAAMARMETAGAPAGAPEAVRHPSGVSWLWNWRWLAPAAAALGALAIWVVVQNVTTPTTPTETAIAKNVRPEPLPVAPSSGAPNAEGGEGAETLGKKSALASRPVSAPKPGRAARAPASEAGAKLASELDFESPAAKPAAAPGEGSAATRALADRRDIAQAPKAPVGPGARDLQLAPGVSPDKTKDATSEFGVSTERQKAKEEAQGTREARAAEVSAVPQQQVALDKQQGAVQAPRRVNEQQAQARPEAAEKSQAATQVAKDELKKVEPQVPAQVAGAVVVESQPVVSKLRQEEETGGRFRAANVAGSKVVWRLGPAGSIERSADGGATWQRQTSGVSADLLAGSAPSPSICWAVGRGGVVLRTTDGSTWSQLGSPAALDLVAVVAGDADRATVTTVEGKSYATTDGGRTWRSL